MKIAVMLAFALFASMSFAQTVTRVTGAEAMINVDEGEEFTAGDRVQFLTKDLNVSGEGEVTKVSAGGKKALVKILAGKVQVGMSLEKSQPRAQTKASPSKEVKSGNISYSSLSDRERKILQIGEITPARYVVGGILGTYPLGFGIGQAIQGRYLDTGWIFTVGEAASILVMISGIRDCWRDSYYESCNDGGAIVAGAIGFLGFKVWEIIDLWAVPPEHNRRYREIRSRLGEDQITFQPTLLPIASGGAMLGLKVTF